MKLKVKWKRRIWKCWKNDSFSDIVPLELLVRQLGGKLDQAKNFADFNRMATEETIELDEGDFATLVTFLVQGGISVAEDVDLAVEMFCATNCHPCGTDLLFYPQYIFGTMNPTVEEICIAARTGFHNGKQHQPEDYLTYVNTQVDEPLNGSSKTSRPNADHAVTQTNDLSQLPDLSATDRSLIHSDYYDGTQLVIETSLPDRMLSGDEIAPHAAGLFPYDSARPSPYYLDQNCEWWAMSSACSAAVVLAMGWMIDLQQLQYRPRHEAKAFLCEVYDALDDAAEQFGATAHPECSVNAALEKLDHIRKWINRRDYQATIVIRPENDEDLSVADWWQAFESVGLVYGDGDMFWGTSDLLEEDHDSYELFLVEPYTKKGYFKPADLNTGNSYPDIVMYLQAKDFDDPLPVFDVMLRTAKKVAENTGSRLLSVGGAEFDEQRERKTLSTISTLIKSGMQ